MSENLKKTTAAEESHEEKMRDLRASLDDVFSLLEENRKIIQKALQETEGDSQKPRRS